jgi:hypothetical protein
MILWRNKHYMTFIICIKESCFCIPSKINSFSPLVAGVLKKFILNATGSLERKRKYPNLHAVA